MDFQNKKKTVLIVDDDDVTRAQLEKELKRNFYLPVTAADGKTAIEEFGRQAFDIMLLDINLPDIDGFEVLAEVKNIEPECEVIVVTGFGSQQTAIRSLRNGAIDYLEKPVDLDELFTALGRAVEKIQEKKALSFHKTLLVIDDDETTTRYLKRFFSREGFEVFTAPCGRTGLEIIENNKIDVVITDIQMKDMDGIEVLKRTKKLYKDIEVIMVTGYQEYAVRSLREGAFDYISKPVNLEELQFAVNKAIERIHLKRNSLYRHRELMISSEIMAKMNDELERRIKARTKELGAVQVQLFQTSKLAILGEISAGMAHEINQPLGGISLVAKHLKKLLERNKLTESDILKGVCDIDMSVKRIAKIIQHVRTFARQDSMEFVHVDVNDTIRSGISLLNEQMRLEEITMVTHLQPDMPFVLGEPYQLEQVWINMLSNARDAMNTKKMRMDNQGSGILEDYRKELHISSEWNREKNTVEVFFADNGEGIPDDILEKVFEPFFTTKEVGKAVGLGLSICYGIIENHKGRIEIESVFGKGTRLFIALPV